MLEVGASGETALEMQSVLKLPAALSFNHTPLKAKDYEMSLANGVWISDEITILPSYSQTVQDQFQAAIETIPFNRETASLINSWVADKTHQKIRDLLTPDQINPLTLMVLANALYFKGSWAQSFEVGSTREDFFYSTPEKSSKVPFMRGTQTLPYFENDRFKAITLPLLSLDANGCSPVCLILLPHEMHEDPLYDTAISDILHASKPTRVAASVPKFKIEERLDLKKTLSQMGMRKAFTQFADFSRINGTTKLFVSDVLHKIFFDFNEVGIEAAAATVATMCRTTAVIKEIDPIPFVADRPFYFVLLDAETETVFFMGYIQNPCN
jgi:serpin B